MRSVPLRTAAIAGTCAVALSFVALPAHASETTPTDGAVSISGHSTPTDRETGAPVPGDSTDSDGADDQSGSAADDDDNSAVSDDSGDAADDDGSDVADDSGDVSDDGSDEDDGDDATPAPTDTAPSLPAEQRTPKQHFADTVFSPKVISRRGVKVVYTGLTAGAEYQPFIDGGQSGGPLGKTRKADKKGVLRFSYKFDRSEKSFTALGATYGIGLLGVDTDLRLEQRITVKYDSDLTWHAAKRHGKRVTLSVSVDRAGASGTDRDWRKAEVDFQKKVGRTWTTVKTVRTNAKGVARASVTGGRTVWRAVVASSGTVFGSTSKGHRK